MFELFSNTEQGQQYFDTPYPIGTHMSQITKDIEAAGGKCTLNVTRFDKDFEYYASYECKYFNDFIAINPWQNYGIHIYVDNNNNIIKYILFPKNSLKEFYKYIFIDGGNINFN